MKCLNQELGYYKNLEVNHKLCGHFSTCVAVVLPYLWTAHVVHLPPNCLKCGGYVQQ